MPRKVYTPQFKEQAVHLASAPGAVVENVAHELNIAAWTLRRWMVEQLGTSRKTPAPGTPQPPPPP
ncbi:MAG: transposase, partial [Phycisphaerales bacterium]|nr:transposase [Phycisphaerales bacterium]